MAYTPKPGGNVVDYFTGSTVITHRKQSGKWVSMSIINDSTQTLLFTINGIQIPVRANEKFADDFEDFSNISIDTNTAYRLVLRG